MLWVFQGLSTLAFIAINVLDKPNQSKARSRRRLLWLTALKRLHLFICFCANCLEMRFIQVSKWSQWSFESPAFKLSLISVRCALDGWRESQCGGAAAKRRGTAATNVGRGSKGGVEAFASSSTEPIFCTQGKINKKQIKKILYHLMCFFTLFN